MIIKKISLVKPGVFVAKYDNIDMNGILVRPEYLSICAADMRYYLGVRPKKVLDKKLPMVLIHEAIGRIVYDASNKYKSGTKVVLLPCGKHSVKNSNYASNSYFRSSNADGFCQEIINLDESEFVVIPSETHYKEYVFSEMLSVCFQGLGRVGDILNSVKSVGVWGDGTLSFLMTLLLKKQFPHIVVTVIGKHNDKLEKFTFADNIETIFDRKERNFDLCIECVGGNGAESAFVDIIDSSKPMATVLLTGVSEQPPRISTRSVLEKGLTFVGTTRSVRDDFISAVRFINVGNIFNYLSDLISSEIIVSTVEDVANAFKNDASSTFKTVIKTNF